MACRASLDGRGQARPACDLPLRLRRGVRRDACASDSALQIGTSSDGLWGLFDRWDNRRASHNHVELDEETSKSTGSPKKTPPENTNIKQKHTTTRQTRFYLAVQILNIFAIKLNASFFDDMRHHTRTRYIERRVLLRPNHRLSTDIRPRNTRFNADRRRVLARSSGRRRVARRARNESLIFRVCAGQPPH